MRPFQIPVLLEQQDLWRAGLNSDYPGMIAAARQALLDLAAGQAVAAKTSVAPRDEELGALVDCENVGFDLAEEDLDWKLSALVSVNRRHGAVKIVGANAFNRCLGLPRSRSTIMLFDKLTMLPLAIMDGSDISAIRTGAYASIVADLFLPEARPAVVVLFGSGRIAEAVIRCLEASHAGRIARISVIGRDHGRARQLVERLQPQTAIPLRAESERSALAGADLIVTATTARHPVVAAEEIPACAATLLLGGDELPAAYIAAALRDGLVYCDDVATVAHRGVQSLALHFSRRGGDLTCEPGIRPLADALVRPPDREGRAVHVSCIGLGALDLYVTEHLYDRLAALRPATGAAIRMAG
jgi:ornithine cyclodeaminase/alanine dehydrogenase-like protein (mu-crystallin family)